MPAVASQAARLRLAVVQAQSLLEALLLELEQAGASRWVAARVRTTLAVLDVQPWRPVTEVPCESCGHPVPVRDPRHLPRFCRYHR